MLRLAQGHQLICSGFAAGNLLARINDGCADPFLANPDCKELDRLPNVRLLPVAVGSWPFLFVVTLEDIQPGIFAALEAYTHNVVQCALDPAFWYLC